MCFQNVIDWSLEEVVDLRSLPQFRPIRGNAFIDRLRTAVAFDYVTVSGLDFDGYRLGDQKLHVESDVPAALVDVYISDKLYRNDPLLQALQETNCFAVQSEVYENSDTSKRLEQLGLDFSVKNRTAFPMSRGDLVFGSVCFMRTEPFTTSEMDFLLMIARPIYHSVVDPIIKKFSAESAKLTEGEVRCLHLASNGLTTGEISERVSLQPSTVDSYIKTAIKKLGARNRTHAIAEAMRRSII